MKSKNDYYLIKIINPLHFLIYKLYERFIYLSTQLAAVNTSCVLTKAPEQRIFLSAACKTIACHGISAKAVSDSFSFCGT